MVGLNLIERKLEGDLDNAKAQKKAMEEVRAKAKEETSRVKSDLLEMRERIG